MASLSAVLLQRSSSRAENIYSSSALLAAQLRCIWRGCCSGGGVAVAVAAAAAAAAAGGLARERRTVWRHQGRGTTATAS